MKEHAFTRIVDSLQTKFDDCKVGLSRLSQERNEALHKVSKLKRKMEKESLNQARIQELESALVALKHEHEQSASSCAQLAHQLTHYKETIEQKEDALLQQQASLRTQAHNIQNLSRIVAGNAEKEKKLKKVKQKEHRVVAAQVS